MRREEPGGAGKSREQEGACLRLVPAPVPLPLPMPHLSPRSVLAAVQIVAGPCLPRTRVLALSGALRRGPSAVAFPSPPPAVGLARHARLGEQQRREVPVRSPGYTKMNEQKLMKATNDKASSPDQRCCLCPTVMQLEVIHRLLNRLLTGTPVDAMV